jgi:hypothetical protein
MREIGHNSKPSAIDFISTASRDTSRVIFFKRSGALVLSRISASRQTLP